jgi:hypothetical protein
MAKRADAFWGWQSLQETLAQAWKLAASYACALAGWNGEVTKKVRRKRGALRGLRRDIVEWRRGDHSGARLKMEQEREKTEDTAV